MPLLYRDAPLIGIWEGSGNVAALDVLRSAVKEPEGVHAFMDECELARGGNAHLDAHLDAPRRPSQPDQHTARRTVEDLGFAFQASLLVRHAPAAVATRSAPPASAAQGGRAYGTLPAGVDVRAIVDRALAA